jgi:hypothetical protein
MPCEETNCNGGCLTSSLQMAGSSRALQVGANLCGGWLNVSFNVKQPINTRREDEEI